MKLGDLRKLAVRQQTRIHFTLAGGMECVVNEKGVAQVPALKGIPNFNLEEELASAQTFRLESVSSDPKVAVHTRAMRRDELAALTDQSPVTEAHDHEED